MTVRVGWGIDAHRFGGAPPVLLAGIVADAERGVEATSDGDVVAHAVADALLGAAVLGDLGMHFPSDDDRWRDADSMQLLATVAGMAVSAGCRVTALDVTVIAQTVRVAPHRDAIRSALAQRLGLDPADVSVKATTTDRMGFIGSDEGLAAVAVVTAVRG